jgi:hypothetical protein
VGVSGIYIRFANSTNVADPDLGNDISSDAIAMISIDFVFGFPFERFCGEISKFCASIAVYLTNVSFA